MTREDEMILSQIKLRPKEVLLQPVREASSFNSDRKKYERNAVAVVKGISRHVDEDVQIGTKVIYDDSHSIDFSIDGVALSIIGCDDIVAIIEGSDNG